MLMLMTEFIWLPCVCQLNALLNCKILFTKLEIQKLMFFVSTKKYDRNLS